MTQAKSAHGEFGNVFLTAGELEILLSRYGPDVAKHYIEQLSGYLKNKPRRKYISHYAVIRNWIRGDGLDVPKPATKRSNDIDLEYLELKTNGIHTMFKRDFDLGLRKDLPELETIRKWVFEEAGVKAI